jgi:hypothetical protein
MFDREAASERDEQARRTAAARRGVRIAGALGATGAAIAIGVTTSAAHAGNNDTTGTTTSRHETIPGDEGDRATESGDDRGPASIPQRPEQGQQQQGQPLAGPGGGGPSQGHSSGS